MRAGVGNDVAVIVVRQIDVLGVAAESKLQDAHAGKLKVVAQFFNIGSDHAQVFSDDGKFTKRFSNRGEQLPAGRFDPTTTLGRFVTPGDFPASRESAEVIDARNID